MSSKKDEIKCITSRKTKEKDQQLASSAFLYTGPTQERIEETKINATSHCEIVSSQEKRHPCNLDQQDLLYQILNHKKQLLFHSPSVLAFFKHKFHQQK